MKNKIRQRAYSYGDWEVSYHDWGEMCGDWVKAVVRPSPGRVATTNKELNN